MDIKIVKNLDEGTEIAKDWLLKNCDSETVLFLSGGKTPRKLYETLVKEKKLNVGAVALVDDRYSLHQQDSNEIMLRESGFLSYLLSREIPYYPILEFGLNRPETAREYEYTVKFLFEHFKKKIAVLGIGTDGHTAGIMPNADFEREPFVADYETAKAEFKERITLTFSAFSLFDKLFVLAFGQEKRKALEEMLKEGLVREVPARFFKEKEISKKTILITDQKI